MTWRSFHAPENARVNGFQDDSRCDAIEETENSLAGVWDTEAFLYAFEVETPQIISRAAHALPDGKCFSRGNPLGLLYEPVPGPMLCSQRRCQRSSSSPLARVRAHALPDGNKMPK